MPLPLSYVPALRPEPDLADRWGLKSIDDGRWLPVVYNSEKEAIGAATALRKPSR